MRPWIGITGVCIVGWLTVGVGSASAAWDNVFQACCHSCKTPQISSFYAPRISYSAPAPQVTYRQRCYYQPVTTYKMQTRLEPVTSYRTSYYYEPVTSYRYTSYYDPCTGCCKRVACPTTSYRLRSQCNAVVNYVQRCEMVPVTSYRRSCCYEPVCVDPCAPSASPGISEFEGVPPATIDENGGLPGISEGRDPYLDPPGVLESDPFNGGGTSERAKPNLTPEPPLNPPVRLDRFAGNTDPRLQGRVVANDQATPKSGARIIFVSARQQEQRQAVESDPSGRFDVTLASGEWYLYIGDGSGKAVYHSRISLRPEDHRLVTVVSR